MRDYEEIQAMVTVLEARKQGIIDRYNFITGVPVLARAPGDKVFMLNGGGVKECRAIMSELNALEWVLESR